MKAGYLDVFGGDNLDPIQLVNGSGYIWPNVDFNFEQNVSSKSLNGSHTNFWNFYAYNKTDIAFSSKFDGCIGLIPTNQSGSVFMNDLKKNGYIDHYVFSVYSNS